MDTKWKKILFWLPRMLSIAFIVFLSLFSLDVFGMNLNFWQIIMGLFMHNIPSLILIVILFASWKHEYVGAIAYFSGGLFYMLLTVLNATERIQALTWSLVVSGPAFFIGALFLAEWLKRKRGMQKSNFVV